MLKDAVMRRVGGWKPPAASRSNGTHHHASSSSSAAAADVSHLLQSLGGVYRDPTRVTRDAQNLLGSTAGTNLRPSVNPLVKNNGESTPPVLMFSGTVTMTYKGGNYNIPMDIYLPPPYPVRPPVCFVRPVSSMEIKKNHKHVDSDGMVYMPYLHGWRPHTHNLVELAVSLSSLFGTNPPVFAKPAGSSSSSTSSSSGGSATRTRPAVVNADPLAFSDEEYNRQASAFAAAAREKEEREMRRAAEASRRDSEATSQVRERLTAKLQNHLSVHYGECRTAIQTDLRDQGRLERGGKVIEAQRRDLRGLKRSLSDATDAVGEGTARITSWIEHAGAAEDGGSVDDSALPADAHSRQMLKLSAENAAITDCLYFLDRSLAKGTIKLPDHLKAVRTLAKRQFLVRAHLMKIGQHRAAEMTASSSSYSSPWQSWRR